jgi:hypothetical protein
MADSFLTLAELAKVNDANNQDYGISDLLDEAPLLGQLAAEETDGDTHKYIKQTGAPTVGFRSVNDGRENSASTDTEVTDTLKLLDCSFVIDKAIADQYRRGPAAYVAREAGRHLRAGFSKAEIQVIYGAGTGGDSAGYVGLEDDPQLNALADEMVIGNGGVGVDVQTSVLAIRTGVDLRDVALILGMDGNIEIGESIVQFIDGATGRFPVYATPIFAWMGVQIGGARSVGRLCNVDATATLDDDGLADLISLFPSGRGPTHLAMNRTSLGQLRKSRTATNSSGAPAPFPTEAHGIPIVVTDSINSTEAVVA